MMVFLEPKPDRITVDIPSTSAGFIHKFVPVGLVEDARGIVGAWLVEVDGEAALSTCSVLVSTEATIHVAVRTSDGLPLGARRSVAICDDVAGLPTLAAEFARDVLDGIVLPEDAKAGFPACLETLGIVQLPGLPFFGRAELRLDGGRCAIPRSARSIGNIMAKLYPPCKQGYVKAVTEHVHAVAMAFAATLDPEAIAYTNRLSDPEFGDWEKNVTDDIWRGIDATFTPNAPLRRHLTAAEEHDELLRALWRVEPECFASDTATVLAKAVRRMDATLDDSAQAMRAFLDCGPMVDAACMEETWYFHGGLFSNMVGLTFVANRVSPFAVIKSKQSKLASVVACLPRDWVPGTQVEWNALASLALPLRRALRIKPFGLSNEAFINAKGRWSDYVERLTTAAGEVALYDAVDGIDHMALAFDRQVLRPCLARKGRRDSTNLSTARTLLFEGRSLPRLLEQSAKWHSIQGMIVDEVARLSPHLHVENKWTSCLPDWTTPDGKFTIKVLTTQRELTEEGRNGRNPDGTDGLAHCVGGSADDCRYGGRRILSVRAELKDGRFKRLSTVEVAMEEDENGKLVVVQHSGRKNEAPPETARKALDAYLARCGDGRLPVRWEECEPQPRVEATLETVCGYDWREPGNIEKVIALWGPCLPRRLRALTPEAMAASLINGQAQALEGLVS